MFIFVSATVLKVLSVVLLVLQTKSRLDLTVEINDSKVGIHWSACAITGHSAALSDKVKWIKIFLNISKLLEKIGSSPSANKMVFCFSTITRFSDFFKMPFHYFSSNQNNTKVTFGLNLFRGILLSTLLLLWDLWHNMMAKMLQEKITTHSINIYWIHQLRVGSCSLSFCIAHA